MSDEIVVYLSKSGFTEKYARWIAQELDCACVPFHAVSREQLAGYKRVVVGCYIRYEKMSHIRQVAALIDGLPDVTLFMVGASPMTDRIAVGKMLKRTYRSSPSFRCVPHFYLQGGVRLEGLDGYERFLLRFLGFWLSISPFLRSDMREAAVQMCHSADHSNRDNICALVEYVKAGR